MKKLILSIALVASATFAFAQKKVVSSAEKNFKKGDLTTALSEIDAALENPETKDDPNTRLLKARIQTKQFIQDSSYTAASVETGRNAFDNFNQTMQMVGNDKESKVGKEVYKAEDPAIPLPENLKPYSIMSLRNDAFNKAINRYNENDYEMAYEFFALSADIDPTDTTSAFNAGYLANDIGNYAGAKKYFERLIEVPGYNKLNAYYLLIQIASSEDQNPQLAYDYVTKARKDYPEDKTLSEFEVQLLLQMDKMDEAMTSVKSALANDPNNAGLLLRYGYLLEQSGDIDGAFVQYKKSVEANPQFFEGNYYTGALYLDKARKILAEVNNLSDVEWEKRAEGMGKEADQLYRDAVPYFDKALAIKPESTDIMEILFNIHSRLKNTAEAEKMNQKLISILGKDWMEK
jgi:tetratricopeptide (TPR) repeat protein